MATVQSPSELADADIAVSGEHTQLRRGPGGQLAVIQEHHAESLPVEFPFAKVRTLRPGLALVVAPRCEHGQPNAYVVAVPGGLLRAFHIGDAVQDVLVCGGLLVVTYFDEGVFGSGTLGPEGLAVFDLEGHLQWGYRTQFGSAGVDISDCYCACTDGAQRVWFHPYTKFPVVELDVATRRQRVLQVPKFLRGSTGLTTDGRVFVFHSPNAAKSELVRWAPGEAHAMPAGRETSHLRGLWGLRFLRMAATGYDVIVPSGVAA